MESKPEVLPTNANKRYERVGTFLQPVIIHSIPHLVRIRNAFGEENLFYTDFDKSRGGWIVSRRADDIKAEPFLVCVPGEVPEELLEETIAIELLPHEVRLYRRRTDD